MPSKFINQVQALILSPENQKYRYRELPDLKVTETYEKINKMSVYENDVQYRIGVSWQRFVFAQPKELPALKEAIVRELTHDIYGEFIHDLLHLRYKIVSREYEGARNLLEKIIQDVS